MNVLQSAQQEQQIQQLQQAAALPLHDFSSHNETESRQQQLLLA